MRGWTDSVTNGTLDEFERIRIVYEKSVQVVSRLIADLTGGRQVIDFWQFLASDLRPGLELTFAVRSRTHCYPDSSRKCDLGIRINTGQHIVEPIVLSHITLLF